MDLSNSFDLARPIEEVWEVLNDVERVATCFPGAQLREVEDGEYRGVVKVKIGRLTADYAGTAHFLEHNHTDYKVVLAGNGLDEQGDGTAEVVVTAKLEPTSDTTTRVNVDTDLTLSGRVAQMGKGVIPDVVDNLVEQFAENLSALLDGDPVPRVVSVADGDRSSRRLIEMPEPEAIDLMDAARSPLLKRLVVVVVTLLFVRWLVRRRRR